MTSTRTATAAAWTLGVAAGFWIIAVREMDGMDMGLATDLGSLGFFLPLWISMMAAMMLPGAVPALVRTVRLDNRPGVGLLFAATYVAVWALVGLAIYALYEPHSSAAAGALVIGAGLYEFTPLKRDCRRRCRELAGSGFEFGLYCVGSSIGLMVVLVAAGIMSVTWMVVVTALIVAQKLVPPRAPVDASLALAIVGLGILIVLAPGAVPGLTHDPM